MRTRWLTGWLLLGMAASAAAQEPDDPHMALNNSVPELELIETPLEEAIRLIQRQAKTTIRLDSDALEAAGVSPDTPVSLSLPPVLARSALRATISPAGLDFVIRGPVVEVTTAEKAASTVSRRFYPVADLVIDDGKVEFASLIDLITTVIEPGSWKQADGPGVITSYSGSLVVSHNESVQRRVEQLVGAIHELKKQTSAAKAVMVGAAPGTVAALEKSETVSYAGVPLREVAKQMTSDFNVPVILDVASLQQANIAETLPITYSADDQPLHVSLRELVTEARLAYHVDEDLIVIGSPEDQPYSIRLFPLKLSTAEQDIAAWIDLMKGHVRPGTWSRAGGRAAAGWLPEPRLIAVAQTEQGHAEILQLITDAEAARAQELEQNPSFGEAAPTPAAPQTQEPPAEDRRLQQVIEQFERWEQVMLQRQQDWERAELARREAWESAQQGQESARQDPEAAQPGPLAPPAPIDRWLIAGVGLLGAMVALLGVLLGARMRRPAPAAAPAPE